MEDYSYINVISKAENLRLYILEHTLLIEEIVSSSLGTILNIDWKKSKSFGYGSSALSFNQKVQIIQDIKGLNNTDIKKLTDLMIIRNKFAHVKSVETFEEFFKIGKSAESVRKNLDNWYGKQFTLFETKDLEFKYKFFYFHLFFETAQMLISKIAKHAYEEGEKDGRNTYLNAIKDEILKMPEGSEIISKAIKKIKTNSNT